MFAQILQKTRSLPFQAAAVILGVLMNCFLNWLATVLKIPFFLDSVFTILNAGLLGLIPGLLTGLLTNLTLEVLRGFPGYLYPFALVNMLSALVTWLHVRYGTLSKASGALWLILTLTLVNSFSGAVIVYILFGGVTDERIDSVIRAVIVAGQNFFTAAFLGRILINIADKGIAVLLLFPLYKKLKPETGY